MKRILFLFTLLASISIAQAQREVTLSWDTAGVDLGKHATVTIGDQLNLIVTITDVEPLSYNIIFPTKEELSKNNIEVLSQRYDTVGTPATTIRQINVVTCFEEGDHTMDSVVVTLPTNPPTGYSSTDPLTLTVLDYPNVDTTKAEIKDIENIIREPYTFWEIFRWVLLALILAALVWAIGFIVKRVRKHEPIAIIPQAPPTPPDQQALSDLEKLRVKELWQSGRVKEYHTELTDIVRKYLYGQYGIESSEMTTDQTLDAYEECGHCTSEDYNRLRQILRTADMVKFAKHEPQPYEHDQSMDNAKTFVRETSGMKKEEAQ